MSVPRSLWCLFRSHYFLLNLAIFLCLMDKSVWSRIEKVNYRQKEKQVLDSILGQGYDKRIRPSGRNETDGPAIINVNIYLRTISRIDDVKMLQEEICQVRECTLNCPDRWGVWNAGDGPKEFWDGPTTVTVNAMIRSISKIDDYKMEYSVQVTFREQWNDERLRYYDETKGRLKYLTLTDPTKVWMPDTFFRNEKEARKHEIIVPNVYVRIFPNGEILYSIRISLTLACPMDLRLYPLDKQVCVLQIASYGWAKDDLIYQWKEKDPVQVVHGLHLPRFTLEQYKSAYCDVITNTGEYSCLKVELIFKREFSYYLITIYVPCCMLVIVSWVSFWLDQNAIPARVSLGVTTLLTMSTQTSGINAQLPPVSYTKAIDVWTGVCQCFVFCALLEFALVNYASRSDMQRDRARERMERARRQWELEHADMEQTQQSGSNGPTNSLGPPGSFARTSIGGATTLSGANSHQTMNHIGSAADQDGIPGFPLKKRGGHNFANALREMNGAEPYRGTTTYPHPHHSNDDLTFPSMNTTGFNTSQPSSLAYMLPPEMGRPCEVHMNPFPPGSGPGHGGGFAAGMTGTGNLIGHTCTYLLCCGTRGLLSKFPSRAKRIDVISRFIFPLIFAIFNLAYWLYYLFAKSKSPQFEDTP